MGYEVTDEMVRLVQPRLMGGCACAQCAKGIIAAVAPLIEAQARAALTQCRTEREAMRKNNQEECEFLRFEALRLAAEARAAAMEEAAKICDDKHDYMASRCAAAIRALSLPVSNREGERDPIEDSAWFEDPDMGAR